MKIVTVSDVSIGYGSGQIPSIVEYLGNFYNAEKIIIEPDQTERPPKNDLFKNIQIKRLVGEYHPHDPRGRIEYIINATRLVNKLKPDMLIICGSYTLPLLFKISFKPQKVIYYCLEVQTNENLFDLLMNRNVDSSMVDLLIFPEENRASYHLQMMDLNLPSCVVYNCTNSNLSSEIISAEQRNGKIIYQGGIHKATAAEYFLEPKLQNISIDMYGLLEDPDYETKKLLIQKFYSLTKNVKYHGYLSNMKLREINKYYSFSAVIWLPVTLNNQWACPNKFFESIASGIPPITAPMPQCKMLCERYDCGIVMNNFSFDSFYQSMKYAMEIDKERYRELVNNCKEAVVTELNWEKQMEKVVNLLKM